MKKPKVKDHGWSHQFLCEDLGNHVRGPGRMVWVDMQMGPSGSCRPDVYTIETSYANPRPTSYECKVTLSDFRSDVTSGKWMSYRDFSECVIFAVPAGLVTPEDVPAQCGLIVRFETVWRIVKRPTRQPVEIPQEALLKLLIDGIQREGSWSRLRGAGRSPYFDPTNNGFSKKYGTVAASWVRNATEIEERIRHAEAEAKIIVERAKEHAKTLQDGGKAMQDELAEILGLPRERRQTWDIRGALNRLRGELQADERIRIMVGHCNDTARALEQLATRVRVKTTKEAEDAQTVYGSGNDYKLQG